MNLFTSQFFTGPADLRASQQREGLEFWRIRAAKNILVAEERRAGIEVK